MHHHLSWLEAGVIGALQGVAELFPVSSLGHSVLIPAMIGGAWARDLNVSTPESPYLAFIVGLHVATAIALDHLLLAGLGPDRHAASSPASCTARSVPTDQRLAWLLVLATIPVGLTGLVLENWFRTTLAKPVPTACFLILNGFLLLFAERMRRGDPDLNTEYVDERITGPESDARLAKQSVVQAPCWSGSAQIARARARHLAIGRRRWSPACCAGCPRGRGAVLVPAGDSGDPGGRRAQGARPVRARSAPGSAARCCSARSCRGVGAYLSVRFLTRYLANRSLQPVRLLLHRARRGRSGDLRIPLSVDWLSPTRSRRVATYASSAGIGGHSTRWPFEAD